MSFLNKIKKKNILLIVLLALLLGISYVNYTYFNDLTPVGEQQAPQNATLVNAASEEEVMNGSKSVSKEFFEEYRLQRESTRSENIDTLKGIAESKEDTQSVQEAQSSMVELVKLSETELLIENQIKSKGFEDCVVFIHEGYVNAVILSAELNAQQAVQIQDIISKNTGCELSNISIATGGNEEK